MKKIMVVDDEERVRYIYARLLAAEGFKVIEASNAAHAYELTKQGGIDLVLLDIKMPEVDGDTLYEVMQLFFRNIKVIIASVYPVDKQREIIDGAVDYYDKSQGVDILLAKVKSALKEGEKVIDGLIKKL